MRKVAIWAMATAFVCSSAMSDELRTPIEKGMPKVRQKAVAKKGIARSAIRERCSEFRSGGVDSPFVFSCGTPPGFCPDGYSCYSLYGAYGPYGGTLYWGSYTDAGWGYR